MSGLTSKCVYTHTTYVLSSVCHYINICFTVIILSPASCLKILSMTYRHFKRTNILRGAMVNVKHITKEKYPSVFLLHYHAHHFRALVTKSEEIFLKPSSSATPAGCRSLTQFWYNSSLASVEKCSQDPI